MVLRPGNAVLWALVATFAGFACTDRGGIEIREHALVQIDRCVLRVNHVGTRRIEFVHSCAQGASPGGDPWWGDGEEPMQATMDIGDCVVLGEHAYCLESVGSGLARLRRKYRVYDGRWLEEVD